MCQQAHECCQVAALPVSPWNEAECEWCGEGLFDVEGHEQEEAEEAGEVSDDDMRHERTNSEEKRRAKEEDDDTDEELKEAKVWADPGRPTKDEIQQHEVTHAQHRS